MIKQLAVAAIVAGALAPANPTAHHTLSAASLTQSQTQPPPPPPRPPPAAPAPAPAPINLNSATAADLEKLPGIGPAVAARIVEYRQKNGAFKKIEDLMNIRGIGEKTFLRLKPLITIAPPKITDR
jgi:competence protein ComEA